MDLRGCSQTCTKLSKSESKRGKQGESCNFAPAKKKRKKRKKGLLPPSNHFHSKTHTLQPLHTPSTDPAAAAASQHDSSCWDRHGEALLSLYGGPIVWI
ncbi:hypothetical protein FKM82_005908 [Ascaphus truei]